MGLSPGFKAFIADRFASCINHAQIEPPTNAGIVVDSLVQLHNFQPNREHIIPPAIQLVDKLFFLTWRYQHVAFCFDHTETTPIQKQLEWGRREGNSCESPTRADARDVDRMLLDHDLPENFGAFLKDRPMRTKLCEYIQHGLLERMQKAGPNSTMRSLVLIGAHAIPTYAQWQGNALVVEQKPNWTGPIMGEADVSCIYAASLLRSFGSKSVYVLTIDTDLVAVGMLHSFDGLFVSLPMFNRKKREMDHYTVDICALVRETAKQYKLTTEDFVLLCLSKKTDYSQQSVAGIADWEEYLKITALALKGLGGAYNKETNQINMDNFYRALASLTIGGRKTIKLSFEKNSWHLPRVCWVLYYYLNIPALKMTKDLDCKNYGWRIVDGSGRVAERTDLSFNKQLL